MGLREKSGDLVIVLGVKAGIPRQGDQGRSGL
jgi:hypothetical protein